MANGGEIGGLVFQGENGVVVASFSFPSFINGQKIHSDPIVPVPGERVTPQSPLSRLAGEGQLYVYL